MTELTTNMSVKLNTGYQMPIVGLGTWQSKPGEVATAVEAALKNGYRHIDCAWAYGNQKEIGDVFTRLFSGEIKVLFIACFKRVSLEGRRVHHL